MMSLVEEHAGDGISYAMVQARLKIGWPLEKALTKPKSDSADRVYVVGNTEYGSLAALAKAAGIQYNAAYRRWKRGGADEEIFHGKKRERKQPVRKKGKSRSSRAVCLVGKSYQSIKDAYDAIGPQIPYNTIRQRITSYGWSEEEAFGLVERKGGRQGWSLTKPRKGLKAVEVNGVEYGSALTAFREIGKVGISTYQARMLAGLSLDVCLGIAPHPKEERYSVFGENFGTIVEVADAYDIPIGTLIGRIANMPLEDAILYIPRNGRFNATAFSRDSSLANRDALLYFISVDVGGESFQKVGITTRTVGQRFPVHDIEVHIEISGRLEKLHEIEGQCMNRFRNSLKLAPEGFEGRTETFKMSSETIDEAVEWLAKDALAVP